MTFRQLELAVLQLTQQLDELMDAIQFVIMRKLPVNLINPTSLHNILKKKNRFTSFTIITNTCIHFHLTV